jgi:hypothetical protein
MGKIRVGLFALALGFGCTDADELADAESLGDVSSGGERDGAPRRADVVDDFERPDGAELGRTTVGGYAWHTSSKHAARLSDGALWPSPEEVQLEQLTVDDFSLQIRVRGEGPWSVGYRQRGATGYRLVASEGTIALVRGAQTLATTEIDGSARWRRLAVLVEGSVHRIEFDGAVVLGAIDPDGPPDGALWLTGDGTVAFDDLDLRSARPSESADGNVSPGSSRLAAATLSGGEGDGGGDPPAGPYFAGGGGGGGGAGGGGGGGAGADAGAADASLPEPTDADIRDVVAPPADLTVPTTLYKMTRFLFDGPTPQQVGADLNELTPSRVALVHGYAHDAWGQPLAGVEVFAVGHPEFGSSVTRSDGSYDFVVTGGLPLALALRRDGYLTLHRHVATKAGDSHRLDDAILIQSDSESSPIAFVDPIEVHHAFTLNDGLPDRMATIMFRQGTQATMVFADESTEPLPDMTVRLTEYTVGPDGPDRMPARLPPGTAYNYALEISADEAEAAGAVSVQLDTSAALYVDNFLGWPVGTIVPSGTYNRSVGRWRGERDGRVIEIVGVDGLGRAEIDIDYDADGAPATAQQLEALGFTDAERTELASIYAPGARLWRVEIDHFTPYDLNPAGAASGEPPPDGLGPDLGGGSCSYEGAGSILEYDNQGLGEQVGVAGTPFTLSYRSARTRGAPNRGMSVDVMGPNPPDDVSGGVLLVEVGGRTLYASAPPAPHAYAHLQWDGLDAYGRSMQGPQPATVCVGWAFPDLPISLGTTGEGGGGGNSSSGSASFGGQPRAAFAVHLIGGPANTVYLLKCYGNGKSVAAANIGAITKADKFRLGGLDAQTISDGLGGWTVDVHHTLARATSTLYLGDGREREVSDEALWTAQRFAGNRVTDAGVIEGPATGAIFNGASAIAVDRQGNVYIGTPGLVRRIASDGTTEVVAGTVNDPDQDGVVTASNRNRSGRLISGVRNHTGPGIDPRS